MTAQAPQPVTRRNMARLSQHVKRFIVQALACYDTPSEVAAAVKEEFDIDMHRATVQCYDPEKAQGQDLSQPLRELFYETRKKFKESTEGIPITNKSVRLRELEKMFWQAKRMGNLPLAASLLEQASKETGNYWTNRRELTGKDGEALGAIAEIVFLGPEEESDG